MTGNFKILAKSLHQSPLASPLQASVTSVNEKEMHSADWQMSVNVSELALPHERSQQGQCAAVSPKL